MNLNRWNMAWSWISRVRWYPYALAVVSAIATVGLRTVVTPWVNDRPTLILFALPIALSAYVGGFGPGLACTVVVTLGALFFVIPPTSSFAIAKPEDAAQLVLLILVGLVLSAVNARFSPAHAYAQSASDRSLAAAFRKMQGGLAIALTCLIAVSGVSYFSLSRLTENAQWVAHTREVLGHLGELQRDVVQIQLARSSFVATREEGFRQQQLGALRNTRRSLDELRRLTGDHPAQRLRLDQLGSLIEAQPRESASGARDRLAADSAPLAASALQRVDEMIASEQRLLAQRESDARASLAFARAVIIGGGVLAFVLVGWALLTARRDFISRLRAEAELERFFSLSLDFLCISSADGYFKRVSPAVTSMLGWSVEEFLSEPYLSFIHPDDHPATLREVERQMKTGESVFRFENRYRHKNGSWRVLSWRSMPQPDGLMYATARDVTDIKAAERALREAKDTLEDRVTERTAELARTNEALDQTARGLQEQLARLALLSRITHAIGERQDIPSVFGVVTRTLEEQLPTDFACILEYDEAGASFSATSVGARSTALAAQLPPQMRIIARSVSGLATCLDGGLLYEGRLAASAAPYLRELAGLGVESLVAAPLCSEGKVFGVLLAGRCVADGFAEGERDFLRQLSEHVALAARQAQLYGALQTAYDDLRLSQQTVMQQERLRVLGQMASGIAHDINNSLSPVMLYAKLLERDRNLGEQSREYLRIMQQSVRDIGDTVARMREFYRPADPDQEFTAVQLNTLLPELVHLTRARWTDMPQQRGVVVRMQLDMAAHLPAARGIESEIREALTNLIFNAVDAMPHGGTITLRTAVGQATASGSATVAVEVIDTGVGMDAQTRRRCLEPFFTTKGERGSGLGLAMVYGTLQRHSGSVAVESEIGAGTTVRLTFPIAANRGGDPMIVHEEIAVRPLRILVVDDDPVLLKSMQAMLEAERHSVVAVDGGQKAIETFTSAIGTPAAFAAVLTDLGMPHVDGRQVAAAIKAAAPGTPVVMITGWGSLMGEAEIPPHVDRLLSKPPKLRELNSALASLIPPARVDDEVGMSSR